MGIIQFDVRLSDGKRDTISVEGDHALIGSGSHCDVRLPMEDAAHEHVSIEVHCLREVGGCTLRAEARADEPVATINGMPLTSAPLSPGAVLGIGRVRLHVGLVGEFGPSRAAADAARQGSSPLVLLALSSVFGAAAYLVFTDDETPIAPPPADAPRLFIATSPNCPESDPIQALGFAEEQLALADGKRERMPFAIADGVDAVALYSTAAACFRQGDAAERAVDAEALSASLRHDLTDELRTRALRLSHMLAVRDYELARRDVAVLRALTSGLGGQYVDWLSAVSKKLGPQGAR